MPFKFAPPSQMPDFLTKAPAFFKKVTPRITAGRVAAGVVLSVAGLVTYDKFYDTRIELVHRQGGPAAEWIQALGESVTGRYTQSPQTPLRFMEIIYGNVLDKRTYCKYDREVLHLRDGENIALDWLHSPSPSTKKPVVVLIPGLTGCSDAKYIK